MPIRGWHETSENTNQKHKEQKMDIKAIANVTGGIVVHAAKYKSTRLERYDKVNKPSIASDSGKALMERLKKNKFKQDTANKHRFVYNPIPGDDDTCVVFEFVRSDTSVHITVICDNIDLLHFSSNHNPKYINDRRLMSVIAYVKKLSKLSIPEAPSFLLSD